MVYGQQTDAPIVPSLPPPPTFTPGKYSIHLSIPLYIYIHGLNPRTHNYCLVINYSLLDLLNTGHSFATRILVHQ